MSIENLEEGFVSKEVDRYSKRSTALRNCLHSPSHNSISSAARSFQNIPSSEMKPKILTQDDIKRISIMRDRPYGLTSNDITLQRDKFLARFGGGSMANCLSGVYEQDYLVEAKLNNAR